MALSLACLAPAPPPAEASPVGIFALEGIVLGASLDFVQDGHPTMFLEEFEYEDPEVGTRYRAYLPVSSQRFIDHIVGRIQFSRDGGLTTMRASFTGERQLYELILVREQAAVDCGAEAARAVSRWGAPEIRNGDALLQWIEQELNIHRRLELRCFPGSGAQYLLVDNGLQARHLHRLRRTLAPFVEQALLFGGG